MAAGAYNINFDVNKKEIYPGDLNNFKGPFNKKGHHVRKTVKIYFIHHF